MHFILQRWPQTALWSGMVGVCYGLQMNAISNTFSLSVFAKCQGRSDQSLEKWWATPAPCPHQCTPNGTSQLHTNKAQRATLTYMCTHLKTLFNPCKDAFIHTHTIRVEHLRQNTHNSELLSNEYVLFFKTSVYVKWIISGLNCTFFPCGSQPKLHRVSAIFSLFELCPAFLCPSGVFKGPRPFFN